MTICTTIGALGASTVTLGVPKRRCFRNIALPIFCSTVRRTGCSRSGTGKWAAGSGTESRSGPPERGTVGGVSIDFGKLPYLLAGLLAGLLADGRALGGGLSLEEDYGR